MQRPVRSPPRRRGRAPPLGAPAGLSAALVTIGGDSLAVIEWPVAPPDLPARLTPAERAVAGAVLAGLSNAAIARSRGRSLRTVANQVASLYRKLGISSRLALYADSRRGRT